ncbi:MAG TPA: tetratricopeptide repeat protein [Kofleriaceae bacterium]|jgi:tetratricopeptide (TPR) repeat protein
MNLKNLFLAAGATLLVACGGGQHPSSGLGKGNDVPPPPTPVAVQPTTPDGATPAAPKVEVSKDAKKDYKAAADAFDQADKAGWNEGSCRASADRFSQVVRAHQELIIAQVMVGLSYERCGLLQDAEKAYQSATHMKGDPTQIAVALSDLGDLYYKAGKLDGARQYWDSAIKANGKLQGARIAVASLELEQMRKLGYKDPQWTKLDQDARFNLSNVLGVNTENVDAYTVMGLIYLEGYQGNKGRLDLAKLSLDEAKKRNEKYAPLQNAFGLYYMRRAALNLALQSFTAAVEVDPKFVEARVNVGQLTLSFRKYDTAKEMFGKAVELSPKNYDAYIGLGIAMRGLKDFDGAEAQFNKALQIDGKQGDAYYDLAVLYKDFRAPKQQDLKASQDTYRKAKGYFQTFLDKNAEAADKAEAKEQIVVIDKTITQIDNFMKAQAAMPPQPPAPPAGAPPAGAPPAGSPAPAGAPPAPAPGK